MPIVIFRDPEFAAGGHGNGMVSANIAEPNEYLEKRAKHGEHKIAFQDTGSASGREPREPSQARYRTSKANPPWDSDSGTCGMESNAMRFRMNMEDDAERPNSMVYTQKLLEHRHEIPSLRKTRATRMRLKIAIHCTYVHVRFCANSLPRANGKGQSEEDPPHLSAKQLDPWCRVLQHDVKTR